MNPYSLLHQKLKDNRAVLMETRFPLRRQGQLFETTKKIYTEEELTKENEPYLSALWDGVPKVLTDPSGDMVFLEPFFQKERLILFGGGHIALPLTKMGAMTGFRVTVVDDRPSFANTDRFPEAEEVICDEFSHAFERLQIGPNDFLVVITRGHRHDEVCLREILRLPETIYTGMIGSKRRVATVFEYLKQEGFEAERIGRICSPIGLPIGSVTPEEISISILAEVIKRKRKDAVKSFLINRSDMEPEQIPRLAGVKEPCSLVTIMETKGSAPRNAGAKMVVYETGRIEGSVGGGCSESQVMHTARQIIGTSQWKVIDLDLSQAAEEDGMVCGGTMRLLVEDFLGNEIMQ